MRVRLWWILVLLGGGCVDLSRPAELERPPAGDAGDLPDAAAIVDAAADLNAPDLTAPIMADAGVDLPVPADAAEADAAPPADAPVPPDLAAVVDAPPLPPDAALPPDVAPLAPDAVPPAPDLAPDLAPDRPPPPPDLAPDLLAPDAGPPPLLIDDFQSAAAANKNNLGSEVTWDHETCNRVNGEMACAYTGQGGYHDFIETLVNWCSFDGRPYRKFRFRLRTSVAGEQVEVFAGRSLDGGCNDTLVSLGTITTSTAMTTYELDLGAVLATSRWLVVFEFDPKSNDNAQFIYDDLQLVP